MENKPNLEDIQKLINHLIYEKEVELEHILLACYSFVVDYYMHKKAAGVLYENWERLVRALDPFVEEQINPKNLQDIKRLFS